jgi:hypothetical protein
MPPADPDFLALQEAVAGRFSLERELGRGGMGVVYLAQDVLLQREVAIKLLAPALAADPAMRRRFLREARTAAQCFHPHIVPIHGVEEAGDLAFLVMSYVRGETLASRLRGGPLAPDVVRRIGREVGWALDYAHGRGVVHRDVKPENILLEAGTDRALITDFGIALRDDPTATPASGEIAGTARYMAPEQALGEAVDGRADLYALGVTLYAAAAGRHPFDGRSAVALLAQQTAAAAPPLARAAPLVPADLADAVDRCLRAHPEERFPSAAAFVDAIAPAATTAEVPTALRPLDESARSARSFMGWAAAMELATALTAIGEPEGFLGRDVFFGVGTLITGTVATFGLFRYAEAFQHARRAVRRGAASDVLQRLVAGEADPEPVPPAVRRAAWLRLAAAMGVALGRGPLTNSDWWKGLPIPEWTSGVAEVGLVVVPLYMIARGSSTLLRGTRLARWFHRRVARPTARWFVRLAGGKPADASASLPAAAPTELRLDHQAQAILARLPAELRAGLGDVAAAVAGLVRDADALRQADVRLAVLEREERAAGVEAGGLAAIADRRAEIRARLGTTIAALEAVRLDLMRLEAGAIGGDELTSHVEAAADVARQVDALGDVERLLARDARLTPNPTPA